MLLSLINVRLKTEEKGETNRKSNALQFLLKWSPFFVGKAGWTQVLSMLRGRGTAVVGTLGGLHHGEKSCGNNGTTAAGTNFHINNDFDRNGRLYGLGGKGC